ncbi:Hypothetical predicted protein [Marmota monax]|uniref:Uncharacterized protein n=1 Tax=Marmota monax TaxID=9995 RepID=A0A5E4AYL9_MARMO|nr:hypothetical protein GHT09_013406 [Marmota monax]VTJ62285.1 Hypothetical predicted protein [Marmota monax]
MNPSVEDLAVWFAAHAHCARLTLTQARGLLTTSPPPTTILCSVSLGNLLPQFGLNPTHLEGESNFTAPHGATPSQLYLFPSDLTQQTDHVSFGGLAEKNEAGNVVPSK